MMLKALPFAHLSRALLLKEEIIISIKKNLKMFIKSGQTKLISSEFAQKIPTNLAVVTGRFLLKFAPKISQNRLILQQICL